ncbi:hypothetical protein O181_052574 [Austropuccinia psidii MF-1]|uniref:Uncharacterized protein n=1 Tax=Austropuccinia psidii MF-1 TaxID=1389203 RepID=A0A9Q3HRT6_9BASI|nr:hypothetical protein [Austropuccinia psidii MF-1]
MEDSRASTSSQRLSRTFETLLESPEADIIAIPVVRPESFPTGNGGYTPVSVQELVDWGKAAGVGTSAKPLHRKHEILSSNIGILGPIKDRGPSAGLETDDLQRTSPKHKGLVEK